MDIAAKVFATKLPTVIPRCPVCQALLKGEEVVELTHPRLGVWAHYFRIVSLPVEGKPTVSSLMALCDAVSVRIEMHVASADLLEALEAVDAEGAKQGKADVALDILAGL